MFAPVRTVLFRPEVLSHRGPDGVERLDPEAPGALAALRFIGVRTVLRADATRRAFFEKNGLAAFADTVTSAAVEPDAGLLVVGAEAAPLVAAMRAGARAAWLGEGPGPSGAHRCAGLAAVAGLVRDEAVESARRPSGFKRATRNLVADFRGLPEETGVSAERPTAKPNGLAALLLRAAAGDASSLKSLGDLARGAVASEEAGIDARDEIMDAWAKLVPASLARTCFPADVTGDTLVVVCSTPVAKNEMRFAERALITAVRRLPGCAGLNRVAYR